MFIVVLGGGIDLEGSIPLHVFQRLDEAIKLYQKYQCKIVLSGKYSFLYTDPKPSITEAEKMAQYLLEKGLSSEDLILEKESKDSIGNAYYLKINVFIPHKEKKAIIITSLFHIDRVKFIFNKVFGQDYDFEFHPIEESFSEEEKNKIIERQKELIKRTKEILDNMQDGDHEFLKDKLYKIKYYKDIRPNWVTDFVTKGKI